MDLLLSGTSADPFLQGPKKLTQVDGLGDMIVHAGSDTFFFITGHGVPCYGYNRHSFDFGFRISDFFSLSHLPIFSPSFHCPLLAAAKPSGEDGSSVL